MASSASVFAGVRRRCASIEASVQPLYFWGWHRETLVRGLMNLDVVRSAPSRHTWTQFRELPRVARVMLRAEAVYRAP